MCGIAGFLYRPGAGLGAGAGPEPQAAAALVESMTTALSHRGPDAAGRWLDAEAGVALGHRRLSILELSEAGAQPFVSPSGRYVLSYNGEIYNHTEIRRELETRGLAPDWTGTSDTETLAAAIDAFGLRGAVERAVGMFAFALWDRRDRRLSLCRDRMGEKPLYYGWAGEGRDRRMIFASQLAALWPHPGVRGRIDRAALVELLRHRCIGGTRTIHAGIRKLLPGTILTFRGPDDDTPREERYWSTLDALAAGRAAAPLEDPGAAVDALEALLLDVVEGQTISDVPLGAFLSGGIDSSLVTALLQARSARPALTFSIGFDEARFDEAPFARDVARHLGTEHTEVYVSERHLLDLVPSLPDVFDEPFADSSQIPTLLLAQIARRRVTVALSGDGGDEIFGGYDRYRKGGALAARMGRLPMAARRAMRHGAEWAPAAAVDRALGLVRPVAPGKEPGAQWARRMGDYLASGSVDALHRKLVSFWRDPVAGVSGAGPEDDPARVLPASLDGLAPEERMMADDMRAYLPDDILAKVDRATMAVSLESRAPLLDHRVVELAARMPLGLKIRGGAGKWVLREVLARHVPRALFERPKMGFEAPIGAWLRGPLRPWAEDLLAADRLARSGYLAVPCIRRMWQEHLDGRAEWGHQLWSALMFEAWLDRAQSDPAPDHGAAAAPVEDRAGGLVHPA